MFLNISGVTAFKAGDYIQLGSSSSARLYLVVEDQGGGSTIQVELKALKNSCYKWIERLHYDSHKDCLEWIQMN